MRHTTRAVVWWTRNMAVGVIFQDKFVLDLNARWSQHNPSDSNQHDGTQLRLSDANGGLTRAWSRLRVMGLGLGGVRIERQVVQSHTRFKDDAVSAPFDVCSQCHIDFSQLIYGFDLGVRWAPMVLVRNYEQQPFFHILPLSVGVRYRR